MLVHNHFFINLGEEDLANKKNHRPVYGLRGLTNHGFVLVFVACDPYKHAPNSFNEINQIKDVSCGENLENQRDSHHKDQIIFELFSVLKFVVLK